MYKIRKIACSAFRRREKMKQERELECESEQGIKREIFGSNSEHHFTFVRI